MIIYIFNEDQYLVYHIKNNQCKKKKYSAYMEMEQIKNFIHIDLEFITLDGPISIKRNVHVS